jgi:hypothetical protein
VLAHWQIFIMSLASNGSIDFGKAVFFVLVPLPDFRRSVGGGLFHSVLIVFVGGRVELVICHAMYILVLTVTERAIESLART